MKSIKDISKLIEDRRTFESRIVKIKQKKNRNTELIIKEVNPIIKIMSDVERKVIKEMEDELKGKNLNIYPVSSSIRNVGSVSGNGKLLKIREDNHDRCGDYYSTSYKIPFVYFDMGEEEIIKEHGEWTMDKIINKIDKYERKMRVDKMRKMASLQKQLQN